MSRKIDEQSKEIDHLIDNMHCFVDERDSMKEWAEDLAARHCELKSLALLAVDALDFRKPGSYALCSSLEKACRL